MRAVIVCAGVPEPLAAFTGGAPAALLPLVDRPFLQHVLEHLGLRQYRLAVEFRHNSWLNEKNRDRSLTFLKDNNLPFVCVDEPQGFKSSLPPLAEVTSDISLIRFHGRNSATWEKQGITTAERFNYLYTADELREWTPRIADLAGKSGECHVLFNNCHEDKAVNNARQISLLLESASPA